MFLGNMSRNYRQSLLLIGVIAINVLLFFVLLFSEYLCNVSSLLRQLPVFLCMLLLNVGLWMSGFFYKSAININESIFKEFTENINEVFWRVTPDLSQTIYVSPAYDEIWGKSRENLYKNPQDWFDSILPEDQERVKNTLFSLRQEDVPDVTFEFTIKHPDGNLRHIYTRGFKFKNTKGELINILGISTDITTFKKEEEVKTILKEIKDVFDLNNHLSIVVPKVLKIICRTQNWDFGEMWMVDKEADVLRSISTWDNSEWDIQTGFDTKSQRITFKPGVFLPGEIWKCGNILWIEELGNVPFVRRKEAAEAGFHSAVGLPIFFNNKIIGVMDFFSHDIKKPDAITTTMLTDISKQIGQYIEKKHTEEEILYASRHDAQTSLLNRSSLKDNLKQLLASPTKEIALILFEIDRFELISSVMGEASDLLLKIVVDRICKITPHCEDHLGLYERNVFAFYMSFHLIDEVIRISNNILKLFNEPFLIHQKYFYLAVNIGMSTNSSSGNQINTLFEHANIALIQSKKTGQNNFNFFSHELSDRIREQLILEAHLRNALSNNEFCLYYQPKVNLVTGEISGVEALLRWQHPVKGLLTPADFIPLAEEAGLIIQLDEWVMREIFLLIKNDWPMNPNGEGLIAFNISPHHFKAKYDILTYIKTLMQEYNVNPRLIEIEITESVLLDPSQYTLKVLQKLVDMGFSLSLDDFGTGFNSLNYLLQVPVTTVKIDKSFIDGLPNNKNSIAIVRAIITLCHSLNKKVIAEGVETFEQAQFLKEEACDQIQGYFFSKAVSINEFKMLISENKTLKDS